MCKVLMDLYKHYTELCQAMMMNKIRMMIAKQALIQMTIVYKTTSKLILTMCTVCLITIPKAAYKIVVELTKYHDACCKVHKIN